MKFRAATLLILTVAAAKVLAQGAPRGEASVPPLTLSSSRLIIDSTVGTADALGFIPPDLAVGVTIEKPIRRHFEAQGYGQYSPDRKYATKDGNNFAWGGKVIWFPRWRLGVSLAGRQSFLWTSLFNKNGWTHTAGIVVRDHLLGSPGRLTLDYVIPSGCVWAAECRLPSDGIQSSRTQGPQFYQEFRIWTFGRKSKYTIRMGDRAALYHFCDQSNPLVETRRTCHVGATLGLNLRSEFGGNDNETW
jgi:hypothetical protein